ncbi:RNA endoribonuclease [Actinomortierella wolfii]|nr:RNA endoribonuclease [Actinomortierella wolfii]
MASPLDALRQQHLLETQNQAVLQRQEQERLLQQQQIQLREQEELFRARHEHDSPHDQHQAWLQFQQHVQQVVTQQQQELLRQQYEAQMALRERQWRDEQSAMTQQMQQNLQHQSQASFPALSFTVAPQQLQDHGQHQHQHEHQQHNHNLSHSHGLQEQQNGGSSSFHMPHNNSFAHPTSDSHASNSNSTDMDIDDEAQVTSIATSIQQLRQTFHGGDASKTAPMPAGWDTDFFSAGHRTQSQRSTVATNAAAAESAAQYQMDQREDFDTEDAPPRAVVVLDTNVLISHLNFISDLICNYGSIRGRRWIWKEKNVRIPRVTFILPWVVVQELDSLKSTRRSGGEVDLKYKAQRAIHFIHNELAKDEQSRGLWGQKLGENVDIKTTKNDDAILECCRYYKTLFPDIHQTRISLISNDRNLGIKAMIHEIGHISFQNTRFVADTVIDLILHGKAKDLTNGTDKDEPARKSMPPSNSTSASVSKATAVTSPGTRRRNSSSRKSFDLPMDCDMIEDPTRAASLNPDGMTFEEMTNYVSQIGRHKGHHSRDGKSHRIWYSGYRLDVNDQELERLKLTSRPLATPPPGMQLALFHLTNQMMKTLRQFLELAVADHLAAFYGARWRDLTDYHIVKVQESDLPYETRRIQAPLQLMRRCWRSVFQDLYETSSKSGWTRGKAERHLDSMVDFVKRWERVEMFGLGKIYRKDVDQFLQDVEAILDGLLVKPQLSPATASERAEAAAAKTKAVDRVPGAVEGPAKSDNEETKVAANPSAHVMGETMNEDDPSGDLLTHEEQEQLYSPNLRIQLIHEWKNRCKALPV